MPTRYRNSLCINTLLYLLTLTNSFTHKKQCCLEKRGVDLYSLTVGNVQSAPCLFIKIKVLIILFYIAIIFWAQNTIIYFFEFCTYSSHTKIAVIKRVGKPCHCLPSEKHWHCALKTYLQEAIDSFLGIQVLRHASYVRWFSDITYSFGYIPMN